MQFLNLLFRKSQILFIYLHMGNIFIPFPVLTSFNQVNEQFQFKPMKILQTALLIATVSLPGIAMADGALKTPSLSPIKAMPELQKKEMSIDHMKRVGPAKKISSVEDLVGNYQLFYFDYVGGGSTYTIEQLAPSSNPDELIFVEFMGYGDLPVKVDLENMTLVFTPKEDFWYSSYYDTYSFLMIGQFDYNFNKWEPIESYAAPIGDDGSIVFSNHFVFLGNRLEGAIDPSTGQEINDFFFAVGSSPQSDEKFRFLPVDLFQYKEEEWEVAGTASFSEGWMSPYIFGGNVTYELEYMTNKKNPDIILLPYPYSNEMWRDSDYFVGEFFPWMNLTDGTNGYILINTSDPDLVIVEGPVYSGYYTSAVGKLYMWNLEGYLIYNGYDVPQSIEMLEQMGFNLSMRVDNIIIINNCVFGFTGDVDNTYYWTADQYSEITLNPAEGGVGSIMENDSDLPVKYYNLQGRELSAPIKGEPVIVRQGNKSHKMIMR